MGHAANEPTLPHYFLHRTFLGDQDLLIIFNTRRCRYQCYFCDLPYKSTKQHIAGDDIIRQFEHVAFELRHSLSVLDRLTISNEGSVLDSSTFDKEALRAIVESTRELKRLRTLVLETRLEFVERNIIQDLQAANHCVKLNILTGFETVNPRIRNEVLFKRESLNAFLTGLDKVGENGCALTAYVLFKPDPAMTDCEAYEESSATIDFLAHHSRIRNIPLTLRINPMYAAQHSRWTKVAHATSQYQPPRLSDVLRLAQEKAQAGVATYIGLSTEGLDEPWGNYTVREDYSKELLKKAILWNNRATKESDSNAAPIESADEAMVESWM